MYEKGALMLNTLRHVIGDDEIWMAVLRGLQEEFRYHTVGTTDIVRFINRVTGTDYTYLFDQYLRFADIPELRIAVDSTGGGNYLSYRWATGVENFHMPIAYRTGDGEQKILFPTTEWQRTIVPVASVDDLIFDTAHFYIRVTAGEKEKD